MTIILLCLMAIILYKVKLAPNNTFFNDYLSHKNTVFINGIFVILVYLSHSSAKVDLSSVFDTFYIALKNHLLQTVVVTFLFYSGYGMCESMKRKPTYVPTLLTTRFPKLLLHFDIAILLYLIVQFFLGKTYPIAHILQAMIGWTSVGNSNWYIFVILLLYVLLYIGYKVSKKQNHLQVVSYTTLLTIVYIIAMIKLEMPSRFYNTVLCFNLGMYYSLYKDKIDQWVMKNNMNYFISCIICIVLYRYLSSMRRISIIYYILWTFDFMAIILLGSMKVQLTSPILYWFGSNVFGVYILQRIPINILCSLGFNQYPYVFIGICLVLTIVATLLFNVLLRYVDEKVFQ